MKKHVAIIAVAVIFAASCAKVAEVESLQRQIDDLKSTEIATLSRQVEGINASLRSLESTDAEVRAYIVVLQEKARDLADADRTLSAHIEEVNSELTASLSTEKQAVLDALNACKAEVESRLAAINSSIASLEARDTDLQGEITELRDYVDGDLKAYINAADSDNRAWVSATFATLVQYQGLVESIEGIRTDISSINTAIGALETRLNGKIASDIAAAVSGVEATLAQRVTDITSAYTAAVATAKAEITAAYTAAIRSAIATSEVSMQSWVNERLTGYYTIAVMDAKLDALERAIEEGDEAGAAEVERLRQELVAAREELTAAYNRAISEAITSYDGEIREHIAARIASVNADIDSLEERVGALEAAVLGFRQQIDDLKAGEIASINAQLENITASIGSLRETDTGLRAYISALQEQASALAEEDEALSQQIDALKAELEGEIDSAKQAVLDELEACRTEVETSLSEVNSSIEALEAKDTALQQLLDGLSEYVNVTLKAYIEAANGEATQWVNATFATLEQYRGLVSALAGIRTDIDSVNAAMAALETRFGAKIESDIASAVAGVDESLAQKVTEITAAYSQAISTARTEIEEAYASAIGTAISSSEESMKAWVNSTLEGYYTIEVLDAKLEALRGRISDADASAAADLAALSTSLATAREELTAAYTQAITDAITLYDGQIKSYIAEQIASVNARVASLAERVTALETAVAGIRADIDRLLGMIQSLVVIPDYSDGSLKCVRGENEYRFEVRPSGLAASLAEAGNQAFKVRAVATEPVTRGATPDFITMPVTSVSADGDILIVKASGQNLGNGFFLGQTSASASLSIESGLNSCQSAYFPLYAAALAMEAVDLGLSVKWGSCNVGAFSPSDPGDYFAWGETNPKHYYSYSFYLWGSGTDDSFPPDIVIYKYHGPYDYFLDRSDDAASYNLGDNWRMPTKEEFSELTNTENCTWTKSSLNGLNGYRVVSKTNGNSIFLPAAGYKYSTSLNDAGSEGYYWSSSFDTEDFYPYFSYELHFYLSFNQVSVSTGPRCYGYPVRPVCGESPVAAITLSQTSLTLAESKTATLTATIYPSDLTGQSVTWSSSNSTLVQVGSTDGIITACKEGTATITATCGDKSATCTVTVTAPPVVTSVSEGPAVDMGLSVKWASCNLGASSPDGYGDYYAWGEVTPYYTEGHSQDSPCSNWLDRTEYPITGYNWSSYKWCNGSYDTLTKYNTKSDYGTVVDNKTVLDLEDDAANAVLGGSWRMPTQSEFSVLLSTSNCTWTWSSFNGVKGYHVVSKTTGNSLFFPAAGHRGGARLYGTDSYGIYWSSSLDTDYPGYACRLYFLSSNVSAFSYNRFNGLSVRPVME